MSDLKDLYEVLKIIVENENMLDNQNIPLFSFEGLPGAGKTTQIKRVAERLENEYGKFHYIDLPTDSNVGEILKCLYSDEGRWNELRKKTPWLNPVLTSLDLKKSIQKGVQKGAKYALMSRGILSTYYYNLDAYGDEDLDFTWDKMQNDMKAFYVPTAIIFMDISEEEAYKRVVKRNRGPLREMDQIDKMRKDRMLFEEYIKRIGNIPVHYIDASGTEEEVTENIKKQLDKYLEKKI